MGLRHLDVEPVCLQFSEMGVGDCVHVRPELAQGSSYLKCLGGEHLRPTFHVLQYLCRYK